MPRKCSGIELPMMEKLQEQGIHSYDQVVKGLEAIGETAYFHTPKNKVIITGLCAQFE